VAGGIVLVPTAIVGGITLAIAGLKLRRRKRRRTDGPPTGRIAGGWDEVLDLSADLGTPVPPLVTRTEAAALLGSSEAMQLAGHADGRIFGPGEPSDEQVDRYWHEVDETRAAMVSHLTRFGQWKVLVNLSSLRAGWRRKRVQRDAKASSRARDRRRRPRPTSAGTMPAAPVGR
jgi:hypothetical protein